MIARRIFDPNLKRVLEDLSERISRLERAQKASRPESTGSRVSAAPATSDTLTGAVLELRDDLPAGEITQIPVEQIRGFELEAGERLVVHELRTGRLEEFRLRQNASPGDDVLEVEPKLLATPIVRPATIQVRTSPASVTLDWVPPDDALYSLGSPSQRWHSLYLYDALVMNSGNAQIRIGANPPSGSNYALTTDRDVIISNGGTATLFADRIGVGVTSPEAKLHLADVGSVGIILDADTDNSNEAHNPFIEFRQDGKISYLKIGVEGNAGTAFSGSLSNTPYIEANANYGFQIATGNAARLTITSSGNVGIGTTGPGAKLSVMGDVTIGTNTPDNSQGWSRVLTLQGYNHAKLLVTETSAGIKTGIFSHSSWGGAVGKIGTESSHDLRLMAGYGNDVMTLTTSGRVGIGTTAPGEKLEVSGNVKATGQLISAVAQGTAPLVVSSNTTVTNLSADLLDGLHASAFAQKALNETITGAWTFQDNALTIKQTGTSQYSTARLRLYHTAPAAGQQEVAITLQNDVAGGGGDSQFFMRHYKTGGAWRDFIKYELDTEWLYLDGAYTKIKSPVRGGNSDGSLRIDTGYGYLDIGPKNAGWCHFHTDRNLFYFNKGIHVDNGIISSYNEDLQLQTSGTTRVTIANSTGNVGIGITPSYKLDVSGTARIRDDLLGDGTVKHPTFTPGWTGSNWQITPSGDAEFSSLTVRGTLRVYELLINQIRATNGALAVTDAARMKCTSVNTSNSTANFESVSEEALPFQGGDILVAQRFTGSGVYQVVLTVSSVNNSASPPTLSASYSGTTPTAGKEYDFVRVGSSVSTRRGLIYLDASDGTKPIIDIVDGVTSWSDWTSRTSKLKVRLGHIGGLTFNGSTINTGTWGLWTNSAYLEGSIVANDGKIAGWNITSNKLYSGNIELISSGQIWHTGGKWRLSNDGSGLLASGAISWDTNGVLNVNRITATSGTIAGWNIVTNKLYSGNIELISAGSIRHTGDAWQLSNDGSGHLAKGSISWTSSGTLTISKYNFNYGEATVYHGRWGHTDGSTSNNKWIKLAAFSTGGSAWKGWRMQAFIDTRRANGDYTPQELFVDVSTGSDGRPTTAYATLLSLYNGIGLLSEVKVIESSTDTYEVWGKIGMQWGEHCPVTIRIWTNATTLEVTTDHYNGTDTEPTSSTFSISSTSNSRTPKALDEVATKLGYASWSNMVTEAVQNGKTIIQGGYLNTSLIQARSIVASQLAITDFSDVKNASGGDSKISGWVLKPGYIQSLGGEITLDSSQKLIKVTDSTGYVQMHHSGSGNWGLRGVSGTATVFELGSTNRIAGWTIGSSKLYNGTDIVLDSSNRRITINGDGSYGSLSNGIFLGMDGGTPKFRLKDKLTFDGTNLTVSGEIHADAGSIGPFSVVDQGTVRINSSDGMQQINFYGPAAGTNPSLTFWDGNNGGTRTVMTIDPAGWWVYSGNVNAGSSSTTTSTTISMSWVVDDSLFYKYKHYKLLSLKFRVSVPANSGLHYVTVNKVELIGLKGATSTVVGTAYPGTTIIAPDGQTTEYLIDLSAWEMVVSTHPSYYDGIKVAVYVDNYAPINGYYMLTDITFEKQSMATVVGRDGIIVNGDNARLIATGNTVRIAGNFELVGPRGKIIFDSNEIKYSGSEPGGSWYYIEIKDSKGRVYKLLAKK